MFGLPGGMEWVILAIIALLVFGGSRLAGAGKNAGKAIREFKEETAALRKDTPPPAPAVPAPGAPAVPAQPSEPDGVVVDGEIVDPDNPRPAS